MFDIRPQGIGRQFLSKLDGGIPYLRDGHLNLTPETLLLGPLDRVATGQGKQGIWFSLFPDRENTGNFAVTQGKCWNTGKIYFD